MPPIKSTKGAKGKPPEAPRTARVGRADKGDDGQPRALHIEQAARVTRLEPHPGPVQPAGDRLVECPYFAVDRLCRAALTPYESDPARLHLLVFLEGRGTLEGEPYGPGDVYLIPASLGTFEWHPLEPATALRAFVP